MTFPRWHFHTNTYTHAYIQIQEALVRFHDRFNWIVRDIQVVQSNQAATSNCKMQHANLSAKIICGGNGANANTKLQVNRATINCQGHAHYVNRTNIPSEYATNKSIGQPSAFRKLSHHCRAFAKQCSSTWLERQRKIVNELKIWGQVEY